MTTWEDTIESLRKSNWTHNVSAGKYISVKYKDYNYAKVSGGQILLKLIRLYYERFERFPDEVVGEMLRDRAYEAWRKVHLRSKL